MTTPSPITRLPTHDVVNQPPPLENYNLFELDAVGPHQWLAAVAADTQRCAHGLRVRCEEMDDFAGELGQTDGLDLRFGFADPGAQAPEDIAGAAGIARDRFEGAGQCVFVGFRLCQQAPPGLGLTEDCGQGLSQFMSDAGGELAHGVHARGMGQAGLPTRRKRVA